MRAVYILFHCKDLDKVDVDFKNCGVFSSRKAAQDAICILRTKAGFKRLPDNFIIDKYLLNEICWVEGYFTYKIKRRKRV